MSSIPAGERWKKSLRTDALCTFSQISKAGRTLEHCEAGGVFSRAARLLDLGNLRPHVADAHGLPPKLEILSPMPIWMYLNIANAGCYSTGWTKACSWLVPHYQSSNSTVLLEREREKAAFRQVAKQWPVKAPWFPSRIMSITTLANKLLFMLWTNYWPLSTSFGNISIQLHILKLFLPQISVCHWNLPRRPCIQPYHQEALKPRRTAVKIDPENGSHTKQCLDVDLLMCKSIGELFYIILCDVCLEGCVHFHDFVISSKAIATPEVTGLGTIPEEALSRVQLLQIRHQWHRDKNRCMGLFAFRNPRISVNNATKRDCLFGIHSGLYYPLISGWWDTIKHFL